MILINSSYCPPNFNDDVSVLKLFLVTYAFIFIFVIFSSAIFLLLTATVTIHKLNNGSSFYNLYLWLLYTVLFAIIIKFIQLIIVYVFTYIHGLAKLILFIITYGYWVIDYVVQTLSMNQTYYLAFFLTFQLIRVTNPFTQIRIWMVNLICLTIMIFHFIINGTMFININIDYCIKISKFYNIYSSNPIYIIAEVIVLFVQSTVPWTISNYCAVKIYFTSKQIQTGDYSKPRIALICINITYFLNGCGVVLRLLLMYYSLDSFNIKQISDIRITMLIMDGLESCSLTLLLVWMLLSSDHSVRRLIIRITPHQVNSLDSIRRLTAILSLRNQMESSTDTNESVKSNVEPSITSATYTTIFRSRFESQGSFKNILKNFN